MHHSPSRYVSSLDLNYIDAKFKPIPPQPSFSLHKRSSPSLLTTNADTSFIADTTPNSPAPRLPNNTSTGTTKLHPELTHEHHRLERLKMDNDALEREIKRLLLEKQTLAQLKTKPVTTIRPIGPSLPLLKTKKSPTVNRSVGQFTDIYESLGAEDNPHHSEMVEMQKAMVATNLHRGIESYMRQNNKRVPHFIRSIRC